VFGYHVGLARPSVPPCRPVGHQEDAVISSKLFHLPLLAAACVVALGCTFEGDKIPTTRPTTRTSDAALRDPYGKWSQFDPNERDIGGGDLNNYNKDAMKRDVDHFWLK
jgi:hypothetical protein